MRHEGLLAPVSRRRRPFRRQQFDRSDRPFRLRSERQPHLRAARVAEDHAHRVRLASAKARAVGSKADVMAVNSGSSQIAKGLGPRAHGMVFAQVGPSPWERMHEITREYQDTMRRADVGVEFRLDVAAILAVRRWSPPDRDTRPS